MIIHISIIHIFSRSGSRSTSASHKTILQMLCTCITRHLMQSHNGLEHILSRAEGVEIGDFTVWKHLNFKPRWGGGGYSAPPPPHTPSWFCLVPLGHLNPGSATAMETENVRLVVLVIDQELEEAVSGIKTVNLRNNLTVSVEQRGWFHIFEECLPYKQVQKRESWVVLLLIGLDLLKIRTFTRTCRTSFPREAAIYK